MAGTWSGWVLALAVSIAGCVVEQGVQSKPPGGGGDPTDTDVPPQTTPVADDDGDGYDTPEDCDDGNADVHPGAVETCNGLDDDCVDGTDDAAAASLDGENYATLDELYAALYDGASATICPGTWDMRRASFQDLAVTLTGVAGRDATAIVEVNRESQFVAYGTASLTLEGLTLGGSVEPAVVVSENATVVLRGLRITGNEETAVTVGPPTAFDEVATLVAEGCEIEGNTGSYGGGLLADGGVVVTVSDSQFLANGASEGGAIWARASFAPQTLVLTGVVVDDNSADRGGGLHLTNVVAEGEDLRITNNHADEHGGGVLSVWGTVEGALISGNDAPNGGGFATSFVPQYQGAPVAPDLKGCTVDSNRADYGGGVWVAGGTHASADATTLVTRNQATVGGGGVWLADAYALFDSTGADWGSPGVGNDNVPDDVSSFAPFVPRFYDDASTFACANLACVP